MEPCTSCRIADWPKLRGALQLTQAELADLLSVSVVTVKRLEQSRKHRCLRGAPLKLLRAWLQDPEMQARLKAAGHPYPWPEDLP